MSWITENAMKRVFNVFKRAKERKVPIWENDIESLKTLNDALVEAEKRYVIDNILFLKLVCICLKELSTPNIKKRVPNVRSNPLLFKLLSSVT